VTIRTSWRRERHDQLPDAKDARRQSCDAEAILEEGLCIAVRRR